MKRVLLSALSIALLAALPGIDARPAYVVDTRQYVGNVVGRIVESGSGRGIPGAVVVLIQKPWSLGSAGSWNAELLRLLLAAAVRRGQSDRQGRFLISGVPTPYPARNYTVVAIAPGYKIQVFDQVPVLPGAVMALECRFALTPGTGIGFVYHAGNRSAPYGYSHEKKLRIPSIPEIGRGRKAAARIFATREGLVGRTTANGHVVRPNDRFAALPSRRALSRNGGREFQVRLTYRNRSVVVPVWDVGPWNIRDDHWNPPARREQWRDLRQGMPQAQAAFLNGHNGGRDGFGRRVANPAGIDLADGTFRRDLEMSDNDWVTVQYLWSPVSIPETTERRDPTPRPSPQPRGGSSRTVAILSDIFEIARVVLERR
jgi:hypothetical protein